MQSYPFLVLTVYSDFMYLNLKAICMNSSVKGITYGSPMVNYINFLYLFYLPFLCLLACLGKYSLHLQQFHRIVQYAKNKFN